MYPAPIGTVTFLFTDIVGSTQLLHRLGAEYGGALELHRNILREAFEARGGYQFNTQGDSMFIAFYRAGDALLCALDAQRKLIAQAWPQDAELCVRMGLHTGEPQYSKGDYFGLDLHRAARITAVAYGGQILLSRRTREMVESTLPAAASLRDVGVHRLKDLPDPEELFQLVAPGLPDDFPAPHSLETRLHHLLEQPTSFVARQAEIVLAHELLNRADVRLLTLTGMGGIGKTRLALCVAKEQAAHFADGVWFVALAPISDPVLVAPAIADALGVREIAGQSIAASLQAHVGDKKMLLVLDNFEQVIAAGLLVAEILAACPQLKILLTSRTPLHLRGEQELPVLPLPVPDLKALPPLEELKLNPAIELFMQRARAARPEYSLTESNARDVAAIVARLDGLALAIELAAARVKMLGTSALRERLDDVARNSALKLLTGGAQDAPFRHQTLRAAINWSHELLDAREQKLLRRLAVFIGGCDAEAAHCVALCHASGDQTTGSEERNSQTNSDCDSLGEEMDVLEILDSLCDKSLLRSIESADAVRFSMLETVRDFEWERLRESGEEFPVRQSHAHFYRELLRASKPHLMGAGDQAQWMDRLECEQDNLRAAFRWLLDNTPDQALAFAVEMTLFLRTAGLDGELRDLLESALARSSDAPNSDAPKSDARANALREIGEIFQRQENFERATDYLKQSIALSRDADLPRPLARALRCLGNVERACCRQESAQRLFDESTSLERAHGDKQSLAASLQYGASMARDGGELERARALYEESASLFREAGDRRGLAGSLTHLAATAYFQNDFTRAHFYSDQSLELFRVGKDKGNLLWALRYLGELSLHHNDDEGAASLHEQYLQISREVGDEESQVRALWGLARVAQRQNQFARAQSRLRETLALTRESSNDAQLCALLEATAQAAAWVSTPGAPHQAERAACLFGALETLGHCESSALPPYLVNGHAAAVAHAREILGAENYRACEQRGHALTMGQLLVYALEE